MRGHLSSYPIELPWTFFTISTTCLIHEDHAMIPNQALKIQKSSVHTVCLEMLKSIDISCKDYVCISVFFLAMPEFHFIDEIRRLISLLLSPDYTLWKPGGKINTFINTHTHSSLTSTDSFSDREDFLLEISVRLLSLSYPSANTSQSVHCPI